MYRVVLIQCISVEGTAALVPEVFSSIHFSNRDFKRLHYGLNQINQL